MLNWLKQHFIPHENNDHKPHFLRTESAALLLALIVLIEALYLFGTYVILPNSRMLGAVISAVLVDQTNSERSGNGVIGTLTSNDILVKAAQAKADDMAARGYFSHNTPDGREPWYFLNQVGYAYDAAGENLAVNFVESSDVTRAWMNSPGHRANILNGKYTEVGIATAQGTYKGGNAIFVVQFFGKPKSIATIQLPSVVNTALASSTETTVTPPAPQAPQKLSAPKSTTTKPKTTIASTSPKATSTPVRIVDNSTVSSVEEETVVAGAQTAVPPPMSDLSRRDPEVVPAAPSAQTRLSLLERIIAMPRTAVTTVYLALFIIILLALLLAIVVKAKIQHPRLILNGLYLLLVIVLILIANEILPFVMGAI